MSPRAAGILGMIGATAVAIVGGVLIAHPWLSVFGALVLVAASIAFAISTTWLYRKSWAKDDWPEVDLSHAKQLKRLRRGAIMQSVLTPFLIGGAVWQAMEGNFVVLALAALAIFNLYWVLRAYRQARPSDQTSNTTTES